VDPRDRKETAASKEFLVNPDQWVHRVFLENQVIKVKLGNQANLERQESRVLSREALAHQDIPVHQAMTDLLELRGHLVDKAYPVLMDDVDRQETRECRDLPE